MLYMHFTGLEGAQTLSNGVADEKRGQPESSQSSASLQRGNGTVEGVPQVVYLTFLSACLLKEPALQIVVNTC